MTLPARVNRTTNLVVASLYVPITVFNVAGGFYLYFYGLGVVLELVVLALIVRWAWTWPRTRRPSIDDVAERCRAASRGPAVRLGDTGARPCGPGGSGSPTMGASRPGPRRRPRDERQPRQHPCCLDRSVHRLPRLRRRRSGPGAREHADVLDRLRPRPHRRARRLRHGQGRPRRHPARARLQTRPPQARDPAGRAGRRDRQVHGTAGPPAARQAAPGPRRRRPRRQPGAPPARPPRPGVLGVLPLARRPPAPTAPAAAACARSTT